MWVARLLDALWVVAAAWAIGAFVALAHLQDLQPFGFLGIGETILAVSLGVGFLLGLALSEDEIQVVVLKAFVVSLGAFIFVQLTVYAPVLTGVAPNLYVLEGLEAARASPVTAIFLIPLNLLGSVLGRLFGEGFKASSRRRSTLTPEE